MSECSICGKSLVSYYDKSNSREISIERKTFSICPNCKVKFKSDEDLKDTLIQGDQKAAEQAAAQEVAQARYDNMIMTTTPTIEYRSITEYRGVVGAQVLAGISIFKDVFAGFRNVVGGRSKQLQSSMKQMREQALQELKEEAFELGANAVVGIKIDFDEYAEGMMMLSASGTAVIAE